MVQPRWTLRRGIRTHSRQSIIFGHGSLQSSLLERAIIRHAVRIWARSRGRALERRSVFASRCLARLALTFGVLRIARCVLRCSFRDASFCCAAGSTADFVRAHATIARGWFFWLKSRQRHHHLQRRRRHPRLWQGDGSTMAQFSLSLSIYILII